MKAKVAVTTDLQAQVILLRSELEASRKNNVELELAIEKQAEQMQDTLTKTVKDH